MMTLAGQAKAGVEGLKILDAEAFRHAEAHRHLARTTVHGVDVGEVHHSALVAQMLKGHILKVKVYAFEQ